MIDIKIIKNAKLWDSVVYDARDYAVVEIKNDRVLLENKKHHPATVTIFI